MAGIAPWFDEYAAQVGHPLSPPRFASSPSEITRRDYSNALVLANAYNVGGGEGGAPVTVQLPPRASGYVDLYGKRYDKTAVVAPQTGAVLLFA